LKKEAAKAPEVTTKRHILSVLLILVSPAIEWSFIPSTGGQYE
jgi:hypothetical protein